MSEVTMLRKMSAKTIIGNVRKETPEKDGDTAKLFTVLGTTARMQSGESANGDWTAFIGEFEATRASDGEVFRSNKLFLPTVITEQLAATLDRVQGDDGKAVVSFAYEVGIQADESAATGYVYVAKPLLAEQADPFAGIRAALPAPEEKKPAAKGAGNGGTKK